MDFDAKTIEHSLNKLNVYLRDELKLLIDSNASASVLQCVVEAIDSIQKATIKIDDFYKKSEFNDKDTY